MQYEERYTDAELAQIIEQGLIYMCACPAQVADAMRKLRELYRYQQNCLAGLDNNPMVHAAILQSTVQSHAIMQDCLDTVIELEKWDRATLEMPANLRQRQLQELLSKDD
ncbi:MAG: hypothetical protein IV109_02160 [Rhodoferax sp.]|nr:hypothetical protein [Rhodoferax sp.]